MSLIKLLDNNEIILLNVKYLQYIINNKKFDNFLYSLTSNNSLQKIEFNQVILNNEKIIKIIDIIKNKDNIKKCYIYFNQNSELKYINELNKLNNIKIIIKLSITNIIKNVNFINFIQHIKIYKYICNTKNISDFKYIINNSNIETIKLINVFNKDIFNILNVNKAVQYLNVYINNSNDIKLLTEYLKINVSLCKLKVYFNCLIEENSKDCIELINLLKTNTSIQCLKLFNCINIDNLAELFKYNKTIKFLYLNGIDDTKREKIYSIDKLLLSLYDNNTLENLYVNYYNYNDIYDENLSKYYVLNDKTFNDLLIKNNTIKILKLLNCNIKIINGLIYHLKNNLSLRSIDLSFNQINNINNLIETLKNNKTLINCDLLCNNINTNNIQNVHNIFKTNNSLKTLNISCINDENYYDIQYFKNKYLSLVKEEQKYNYSLSYEEIIENIQNNTLLELDYINFYKAITTNQNIFFELLKNNTSINKINISCKAFEFPSIINIINILKDKTTINELYITIYNIDCLKYLNYLSKLTNIHIIIETNIPHLIENNFNFKSFITLNNIYKLIINNNDFRIKQYFNIKNNDIKVDNKYIYEYDNKEFKDDIYYIINNCNIEILDISNLMFNEKIFNFIKNNQNKNIKHIEHNDITLINMFKEKEET